MKIKGTTAFMDTETTGTSVHESRIVQIAIIKVFPDGTTESKTRLINPTVPIPPEATEVHGITDEMVAGEPTFAAIAKGVHNFIADCDTICGFNTDRFDLPLLYNEFLRAGITWDYKKHALVDLMKIYHLMNKRDLTAAVAHYLGEAFDDKAHDAANDAMATLRLSEAMIKAHELPTDPKELESLCNGGKQLLDLSGVFCMNDKNEITFSKGKHAGETVMLSSHKGYLEWMAKANNPPFNPDTMEIVNKFLNK